MSWIRLEIEDEVHRRLKANAALAGKTLAQYLTEILTKAAEKNSKK